MLSLCRATDLLLQSLVATYPYMRRSTQCHEIYIHALLQILEYAPHLRSDILSLIINRYEFWLEYIPPLTLYNIEAWLSDFRLSVLDVNAPRPDIDECEDEDDMEEGEEGTLGVFTLDDGPGETNKDETNKEIRKMKHPVAHTLDVCMEQVLAYIYNCCHVQGTLNLEALKSLYHDLLKIFEHIIMPTHASHHVQFIMFYICSFKPTLCEAFVNWLWRKVSNPNVAPVIRQSSVSYIASLLARATFVQLGYVHMQTSVCPQINPYDFSRGNTSKLNFVRKMFDVSLIVILNRILSSLLQIAESDSDGYVGMDTQLHIFSRQPGVRE